MNRRTILLVSYLLILLPVAWGQEAKIVDHARKLTQAWAKDGIVVENGIVDGTQNLAVIAAGGYFPLTMTAKAGVPTVLRLYTNRTYDCSRSFVLPDLKKQAVLPVKGVTAFPLPPQKKGSTLFGTCGMGMYTFEIRFE